MKEVAGRRPGQHALSTRSFERDTPLRQQGQKPGHPAAAPVPRGRPQAHVACSGGQLASVRPGVARAKAKGEHGVGEGVTHWDAPGAHSMRETQ